MFTDKFLASNWPQKEAADLSYMLITMAEGSLIFSFTHQSNEPLIRTQQIMMEIIKAKQREVFGHDK